ncbi:MAG: hypothetical protein KC684_10240 [Candidatus Omnitrophica bacterium]|nr:hypothetical protein [Candidatus Omnitrophota bacterium]
MPARKKLTPKEKNLTRRYLIWCYKTTKEELDKIDRYYTQLPADRFILDQLKKSKDYKDKNYRALVDGFSDYMDKKKANVDEKKFSDKKCAHLKTEYLYLKNRFQAIERAIIRFLGKTQLAKIEELYEVEMTQRILSAREH